MTARVTGSSERGLGVALEFLQDFGGNFLGRAAPAVNLDGDRAGAFATYGIGDEHFFAGDFVAAAAHETFDGINGLGGFEDAHAAGFLADDGFRSSAGKMDDRGREPLAVGIGNDERNARIHRGDQ